MYMKSIYVDCLLADVDGELIFILSLQYHRFHGTVFSSIISIPCRS